MRKPGISGFTLIEMLVVVAMIGVSSSIAVWTLNGTTSHMQESQAAYGVERMLERLRSFALTTHSTVQVTVTANTVTATSCAASYRDAAVCAAATPFTDVGFSVTLGDDYRGVTLSPATFSFNARGELVSGTTTVVVVDHPGVPGTREVQVTGSGFVDVVN